MLSSIKKNLKRKSQIHQIQRLHYHKHHWEPIQEREPTIRQTLLLLSLSLFCLALMVWSRLQGV